MEMASGNLRDLFTRLFAGTPIAKEVIDPRTGEMALEGLFEVALNGVAHNRLPNGMETQLQDGDTLTLSLVLIGGG